MMYLATGCAVLSALSLSFDLGATEMASPLPPQGIYGGQAVEECEWPFVVAMDAGCTGVLVSPEHVLTAAHCGSNVAHVSFGENIAMAERRVEVSACERFPGGEPGRGNDLMLCTLATPQQVPAVPPLTAEEASLLKPGGKVLLTGFGETEAGTHGTKRAVWATLGEENEVGERRLGGDGIDTCNGDSGGPALVLIDGLGWRVLGITSYGFTCGEGGWYTQLHHHEAWLADNTVTDQCSYPWDADEGEWGMSCVPSEFQGEDACALGDDAGGCSITSDSVPGPGTLLAMLLIGLRKRQWPRPRVTFRGPRTQPPPSSDR